jgi:m7GpppX diphosphatase
MSNSAAPISLSRLNEFSFTKVLHEDPFTHSIVLLGTFPSPLASPTDKTQAIVRIEKTALNSENPANFFSENGYIQRVELEDSTDIV